MITLHKSATLLAAWPYCGEGEEVTQSGDFSAQPYLKTVGMGGVQPLNPAEIDQLSRPGCGRCRFSE